MSLLQTLPWIEPLELARTLDEEHWVLLYSGTRLSYSGRYSYLAHQLNEKLLANDFKIFGDKLTQGKNWHENAWFGYLGYGLKNTLEALPADLPGQLELPDLAMLRFNVIYRFDHEEQKLERWSHRDLPLPKRIEDREHVLPPTVTHLHSNMTNKEYLEKVCHIIERIHAGDLYQANLTRKFYGEFAQAPDSFALFKRLCEISPAPYSAYLHMPEASIISSSPELFLKVGADGAVRARPIKGTAPRFPDTKDDEKSRHNLAHSAKDMAENLMIVDLMRNDLAHTCKPGSIEVRDRFDITSHANVHHMSSTVTGIKNNGTSALETVKYAFPPGSMTGAPKIKAIKLCTELERQARGVYSGAIGFFDGTGGCELSVVIRTIIVKGNYFEFQVGGGIVADSSPESELSETFHKARGLMAALNLPKERLESL